MNDQDCKQLQENLRGRVIGPADADYDETRALYNGMIDKRPRLIARCVDTADVVTAVRFGREHDLLTAVRGGGHSGPGLGSCDDGLVIDLSPMKGVHVDPSARTVRAQPGCTQGDVDHATHAYGIAVPAGIVSSTGVSGLTLGGGHGYLSRKHGLTIDNLLEVEVVLADGRVVTANAEENDDLFWGLRGGGGNFGVVTSFLYRAHPATTVYAGPIFWDFKHARDIMRWYRDFLPDAPRELCPFLGLKRVPSAEGFPEELWNRHTCALICCYNGTEADGLEAMRRIRDELPEPMMDGMMEMPLPAWQAAFDPLLPPGMQWYWKGDFVQELSDDAIEAHIEHGSTVPDQSLSLMHLYPIDGAVHEVEQDAAAWSCRDATWSMVITGIDPKPDRADTITQWARSYWEDLHRFNSSGAYVNFMMEEGDQRVQSTYGPNYERLVSVKAQYDPDNFFRVNQNIPPKANQ